MKKIIALLLALLMVFALVACGQAEVEEVETPATEVTEETPEAKPYEGVTLVFWDSVLEGTPAYDVKLEQIAKWEEMTGATVEFTSWGQEIGSMTTTALDAGETLDIIQLGSCTAIGANLDHLLQLDDMLNASDLEERGYAMAWDQIRNWVDGADGKVYAIADAPSFYAWWYDKAAFEKAGIEAVPTTIEEFEEACDKLLAVGITPMALDVAYTICNMGVMIQNYVGADVVADLTINGGWTENEDAIACFDKIIEWKNKGYFDENAPAQWPASQNKIGLTGENAMVYCGTWLPGEIDDMTGSDIDWGCFLNPHNPDGKGQYGTALTGSGTVITNTCENPQAAFDLIYFLKTGEADQAIADVNRYVPYEKANEVPAKLSGSKELLESMDAAVIFDGGLYADGDKKTSVIDLITNIYAGMYETGLEACEAFDALCKG